LENQPSNFPVPRCGGRENQKDYIPSRPENIEDKTMSAYMVSLETLALAQNPQDAGPTAPPKRHRRFTISYANATKQGLIDQNSDKKNIQQEGQNSSDKKQQNESTESSNQKRRVSWAANEMESEKTVDSSLQRSVSNTPSTQVENAIDAKIKEIRDEMEKRMTKQESQILEIVQVVQQLNENIEQRMAHAVLAVIAKEKEQLQELTHGRIYDASHAPLADKDGNLPYGGKVQQGGPLDRLHHVEVTVQQMANALDTIAEHLIQKDPSAAKQLFVTDSDSETETNKESEEQIEFTSKEEENKYLMHYYENDVPMKMVREFSGTKRMLGRHPGVQESVDAVNQNTSSPQRTPPPKREKSSNETSANPNEYTIRERGET
jgi:hypothetical protein